MDDNDWCYYQLSDGILKGVWPTDKAYDHGWGYVYTFRNWWDKHHMSNMCMELLGPGAWRSRNWNTLDDANARWANGIGNRIYFRSMQDMKLCCMQQILSEIMK